MDAYTGQIILFAGKHTPRDWAQCDGRVLKVSEYPALYSLIGNRYGGTAGISFALPDLRGRIPVGQGTGKALDPNKNLTTRTLGQSFGSETVLLTMAQIPAHQHELQVLDTPATMTKPTGSLLAKPVNTTAATNLDVMYFTPPPAPAPNAIPLSPLAVQDTGSYQAHENRMPSLALNYLICLNGLYPNRP